MSKETKTIQKKIREKIEKINANRWWGDDFDVRFYLLSKIKEKQKICLDVGGGIGIICSEINQKNFKINLELNFDDLKISKTKIKNENNICASMFYLPFKENSIDIVICANILEVAKKLDIEKNSQKENDNVISYPSIEKIMNESQSVLKNGGKIFGTTPNNIYYKTCKLTYQELEKALSNYFKLFKIIFFNTHKRIGRNRKLNLANTLPKVLSKFRSNEDILSNLAKKHSKNDYSVSFYFEGEK